MPEVYRAVDAWRQLYRRQPESSITFEQYLDKMQAAGLRPSMIGLHRGKFSLARIDDTGGYHRDNCRFIPIEQNVAERKEGYQRAPEFRALMSKLALKREKCSCQHCGKSMHKSIFSRWHGDKCKFRLSA